MNQQKSDNNKEQYARAVSLFLAEELRVRKISLPRAAEIAQKVVENINLIDSEARFLGFIKEISSDFEELFQLQERIDMHMKYNARREFEEQVREFAILTLSNDAALASQVLQEAVNENSEINQLCAKFPQFASFIKIKSKI